VASGTQVLLGGEQLRAAQKARLTDPANVTAREQSSTAYEGLSPQAAGTALQEAIPDVVDNSDGGPPPLAEGQKATGFPSDYAMSISGPGMQAVVESLVPLALEGSDGKRTPLDLSLHKAEGGFQPAVGFAPVRLGRNAGEGATLLDSGVSLTPVTEGGAVLSAGGAIDHASSVFYGDTEDEQAGVRDLSMLAKPTVGGFELFSVLFSQRSPEHLTSKLACRAAQL
jgi:hypothetical protein